MKIGFVFSLMMAIALASLSAFASDVTPVCVRTKNALALTSPPSFKKQSAPKKSKSSKNSKRKSASSTPPPPPGMNFPQYSPLKWTGKRENGWYEVKTIDNISYWMRRRDLSFKLNCLIVLVSKSRMYKGPGTKYEKADLAEQGMVFLDLGGEDGWTQVQNADGKRAWINLDHTWKPASRVRMSFSPDR